MEAMEWLRLYRSVVVPDGWGKGKPARCWTWEAVAERAIHGERGSCGRGLWVGAVFDDAQLPIAVWTWGRRQSGVEFNVARTTEVWLYDSAAGRHCRPKVYPRLALTVRLYPILRRIAATWVLPDEHWFCALFE